MTYLPAISFARHLLIMSALLWMVSACGGPEAAREEERLEDISSADSAGIARVWDEARRQGIDFRGIGQEPGWLLEIREEESIRFAYDYAQREVTMPYVEPVSHDGATLYATSANGQELLVTVRNEPCQDVMSGERFEAKVQVQLDSTTYNGCGRSLR